MAKFSKITLPPRGQRALLTTHVLYRFLFAFVKWNLCQRGPAKASAHMKPMAVGDLDQIRLESPKLQDILSAPGSERAAVLRSNPEAARTDATRATTRDLFTNTSKTTPELTLHRYGRLRQFGESKRSGRQTCRGVWQTRPHIASREKLVPSVGQKGSLSARL
jgi:hypothetical protein